MLPSCCFIESWGEAFNLSKFYLSGNLSVDLWPEHQWAWKLKIQGPAVVLVKTVSQEFAFISFLICLASVLYITLV